jgi:hypothetical protein
MRGSTSHTPPYYIFNNCRHQIKYTYCTTQVCPCFEGFHIHITRIQTRAATAELGIFHTSRQTAARCGPWSLYYVRNYGGRKRSAIKQNDLVWQWIWHRSDLNYPFPFGRREGRFVDIFEMSTNGTYKFRATRDNGRTFCVFSTFSTLF